MSHATTAPFTAAAAPEAAAAAAHAGAEQNESTTEQSCTAEEPVDQRSEHDVAASQPAALAYAPAEPHGEFQSAAEFPGNAKESRDLPAAEQPHDARAAPAAQFAHGEEPHGGADAIADVHEEAAQCQQ